MTESSVNPEVFPSTPVLNALVRFGIIPIVVIFYVTASLHFDHTPDGTYVYLQYARHLATGEGFSFNQSTPTYGVASPLWVAIISAGTLGGLDPYIVAKTLDLVFAALSILVLYFVAFAVIRSKLFALAACCIFSFDAWFLQWAGSGMETSLGILLSLLTLWYVYRNDYILASFVCSVFTLVRPEGMILFVLIQIDNFVNSHEDGPAFRVLIKSTLMYLGVLLPWFLVAFLMFGTIIPNTVQSSLAFEPTVIGTLAGIGAQVKIVATTQAVLLLFLIVGTVMAFRRMPWRVVRLELFPLSWVLSLAVFYGLTGEGTLSRSLLLILPEIVAVGLWGMKKMQEFWKLEWRGTAMMLSLTAVLAIIQNQFVFRHVVLPQISRSIRGMNDGLKPIAYWLREHGTPQTTIVTPEVGLIGYVAQVRVFDPAGRVTPGLRWAFQGKSYEDAIRSGDYESIVRSDFVLDCSSTPDRLASMHLVPALTRNLSDPAMTTGTVYYTLYRRVP